MLTEKVSGIDRAMVDILQNSKNFVAETTFKVAAQKETNTQGSTIQGVRSLEEKGFRGAAMDAVISAYERTLEMKKK